MVAEKDRKKPYEVDFKVHSIEGIVKNQDEVTHVANILGILKEHAADGIKNDSSNAIYGRFTRCIAESGRDN